jgi:hypothetical protein
VLNPCSNALPQFSGAKLMLQSPDVPVFWCKTHVLVPWITSFLVQNSCSYMYVLMSQFSGAKLMFDLNDLDLCQIRLVTLTGTPGVRLHVCAKFGDRIIFVNLNFDLNFTFDLNDLDLCQIQPLSDTPAVRLHVYAKCSTLWVLNSDGWSPLKKNNFKKQNNNLLIT